MPCKYKSICIDWEQALPLHSCFRERTQRQPARVIGEDEHAYLPNMGLPCRLRGYLLLALLTQATRCVRLFSEGHERPQEMFRLACEEPVLYKTSNRSEGAAKAVVQRPDHGAARKISTNEFTWNRKNQICLEERSPGRDIEIREGQAMIRNRRWCIIETKRRALNRIAREVHPLKEMSDLIAADAEQNL